MQRRDILKSSIAGVSLAAFPTAIRAATGTAFPWMKKTAAVNGNQMAYVDSGDGEPVVFLHGNPTSSYLWRNIIPHIESTHRAIAPDLIGMGDSAKPGLAYTYSDHAAHLHGLLDALDLRDVTLVLHDWGSALGFDWAMKNEERVRAIAFMEAMLPPVMPFPSLEAMGPFGDLFRTLRTVGPGEEMVLNQNFFVEEILANMGVATPIGAADMDAYRAPFPTPESRLPTLAWPRQIPIGGEPAQTDAVIRAYSEWFLASDLPKLMLHAEPGALMPPEAADWLKANLKNLESVFLGPGVHFLQEDHPDAIGNAIANWLARI